MELNCFFLNNRTYSLFKYTDVVFCGILGFNQFTLPIGTMADKKIPIVKRADSLGVPYNNLELEPKYDMT